MRPYLFALLQLLACGETITEDANPEFDPIDFLSKSVDACDAKTLNYMAIAREDLAPWDLVYNEPEDTVQKIDYFDEDGAIASAEFRAGMICEFFLNRAAPPSTERRLHVYERLLQLGYTEMGTQETDANVDVEFLRAGRSLLYSFSWGTNPDGSVDEHYILTTH